MIKCLEGNKLIPSIFITELAVLLRNYCHPHFIGCLALVLLMSTWIAKCRQIHRFTVQFTERCSVQPARHAVNLWLSYSCAIIFGKKCALFFIKGFVLINLHFNPSDTNTWLISFCFYIFLARELFDILIKQTLAINSFSVEDIPDLSEMTICLWLKIGAGWSSSSNKRMYLVSYDVDAPNTLKTNSFFLGLDDSKSLIFGIGTEAQPW